MVLRNALNCENKRNASISANNFTCSGVYEIDKGIKTANAPTDSFDVKCVFGALCLCVYEDTYYLHFLSELEKFQG